MKKKMTRLRPSPNEEARIIREECHRRRKLRLQQVREQQREFALHIRQEVEVRRQREFERLENELREEWEQQHRKKLENLQQLYQESLQLLGQSHRDAKENEPDMGAIARKEVENYTKAKDRYQDALKELKSQRLKDHERQNRLINARKKALQAEKVRSARVARLPLTIQPSQNVEIKRPHVVKKIDLNAFTTTHYHMSEGTVERERESNEPTAQEEAQFEVRRLGELQEEEKRRRREQLEKARHRGMLAMRREHLTQDHERMLDELEHMHQADRLRKRQQVSTAPSGVPQPLYTRQEAREDFQREMEFALEDMYTGERGDTLVQLVPKPLPALSLAAQDQDLNVTLDEVPSQGVDSTHSESQEGSIEQDLSNQVKPSKPAPKQVLKKLLNRIRSQRNDWSEPSHASAAEPVAVLTDEIPERDTSIDTGSLASVEKNKRFPSVPELEKMKQVSAANSPLPDVPRKRIQEFTLEKEKQQEELKKQTQEQVSLLQELEEQRVKLEQVLLEAQHEREHLKAAVRAREQQAQRSHLQAPGQELPAAELHTRQPPPPAGDDDQARRLQEYQQRLLEQNRIHQRTVKEARQGLEEYKRALQLRYTLTARAAPPPPLSPPRAEPPPPHPILQPPFPPQFLPATVRLPETPAEPRWVHIRPHSPMEMPTRAADRMSSPLRLPAASLTPDKELTLSSSTHSQSLDDSASLADDIMERATKHLPERVRPSAFTREPPTPSKPAPAHQPLQSSPVLPLDIGQSSGSGGKDPTIAVDEVDARRRELREAQRRVTAQREAVLLQQGEQQEKLRRQQAEMEQMRRQREALQALMQTNVQPPPPTQGTTNQVSKPIGETRRKLLASLLKAIEDNSGGTLSHLEEHPDGGSSRSSDENITDTRQTDPIFSSDAPVGPSFLVLPLPTVSSSSSSSSSSSPTATKPPVTRVRLVASDQMTQQHELSVIKEVETPANVSQVAGLEDSVRDWDPPTVASDRALQSLSWSSRGQQIPRTWVSAGASSGRSSHPAASEAEACEDPSEAESRKMSSLSSDSGRGADYSGPAFTSCRSPAQSTRGPHDSDCVSVYTTISTGSYVTTDPEQNQSTDKSLRRCVEGQGTALLQVCSPSTPSVLTEEGSDTRSPGQAVESLFRDSNIQNIVDRYTRELNFSLRATGRTTGSPRLEDSGSSLSQQSLLSPSEGAGGVHVSRSPSPATGTQESRLQASQRRESSVHLSPLSGVDASRAEGTEHDSFQPLIGYAADQSSLLPADHRDAAMERLVGQPSAHSSSIGQLPGLAASSSGVHSDWDSTLSRMMGQFSQQSAAHWLSGGQNQRHPGHSAQEPRSTWLDDVPEESLMVALVGELDESTGRISGSSGERTRVDLGALSHLSSSHAAPVPSPQPRPSAADLLRLTTEASASESFHQLFAEVTHNQTVDPSMTFHPPEEQPDGFRSGVSEPHQDSAHSDLSPERFRAEEAAVSAAASLDSFAQLLTFQHQSQDSVSLLSLTSHKVEKLESSFRSASPVSEGSMEPAGEKGILEQSQITLVSVTDTTVDEPDTTVTDEATWGDKDPDAMAETENQVQTNSVFQDRGKDQAAWFLELDWGPGGDQQRRQELFQRSTQRVEEIKARRALEKSRSNGRATAEAKQPSKVKRHPPVAATCEVKSEPRKLKPDVNSKSFPTERTGSIRQKKVRPSNEAGDSKLSCVVDVQICTTEQRKQAVSEMHQRTQRLYEQLEEVKQQRTVKNRQEAYAKNRIKAKEFHKKTLQKLRAKQSLH